MACRATTKWQLTHSVDATTWQSYLWVDVRLHVVAHMSVDRNVVELRDIRERDPPAELLQDGTR
jgi:hypothetical protein